MQNKRENREKKEYTIGMIAEELGLSKSTVSRAISGKGRIGKATRDRVWEFARQHGYQPNVTAKALAGHRTYNIGLLLPGGYAAEFPFFRECMDGICSAAHEAGYDVLISMERGQDISPLKRMAASRKIDGMILSRTTAESAAQHFLKEMELPFVVIGPCTDPGVKSVDNRNEEAACELTGLMLMKGMRRLALIGGSREHLVTRSRRAGFERAHEERGIPVDAGLVFMDVCNHIGAMQAVNQALSAGADGLICMDDLLTGLTLGCLREKGVRVPGEIRVASLYDSAQLEYNTPSVTSLRFNTEGLGRSACRMLLAMLGEEMPDELPVQNYQVILRESTK